MILNVALLNKFGFKISHIDRMNHEEMNEKILSLNQQEAQLENLVNSLIQYMIELDTESFENVLNNFIETKGIEKTIVQIIFPYLEKIGILWLTNHINPAQEHLVSNIIRQKLIVGINNVSNAVNVNKTVLLFLPETEYHELSLLFVNFMLKSKGVKTIYLGTSVPLKDVAYIANIKKPDYIYTHITTLGQKFNFDKFIQGVSMRFADSSVFISGQLINSYEKKMAAPVKFLKSYSEVMDFIHKI